MTGGILIATMVTVSLGAVLSACDREHAVFPDSPIDVALDGDTVIIDHKAYNIAGIDAPELGPWAKCWSEAALAGHARDFVESTLYQPGWRIARRGKDANGRNIVQFARKDGSYPGDADDLADEMIVAGYAARTDGKWDWCGEKTKLESLREGTKPPHGPNLWWPTGKVYDSRAAQ